MLKALGQHVNWQLSFHIGVILYLNDHSFDVMISSQLLNNQLATELINSTETGNNPPHPFYHATLSFHDMAEITGQSIPSYWPTNTALQSSFSVQASSASATAISPALLFRAITFVLCCYCMRSPR